MTDSVPSASAPDRALPLVLIVEDDPLVRQVVCNALSGRFRTESASDGAEGLRRVIQIRPDLVLSDLTMPALTGLQLLHALRARPELDDMPVMILTALAEEDLRVQLLREGAQDFVLKPFSVAELRARVDNLVKTARAKQVLRRELASNRDDLEVLAEELAQKKREAEGMLEAMRVARDHAEHASEIKGLFLGLVSHELRTPLAALALQLHLLRDSALEPRQRDLVGRIERSASRLGKLIESLLQRAHLEGSATSASLSWVSLDEVVGDALAWHAQAATRKGLALSSLGQRGVHVESDAHVLRLILSSLLDNAIKFTDEGEVAATIARAPSSEGPAAFRIAIRDTGPGIAPADQLRIFAPFEHVAPMAHKHAPGLGLGLALVRDLAQIIGARVELESSPGLGSTFTLTVPCQAHDSSGSPPVSSHE